MRISYIVQNITLTYFILRKLVKCQLFHEWTGFFPRCMYEGITNGNTFLFAFFIHSCFVTKNFTADACQKGKETFQIRQCLAFSFQIWALFFSNAQVRKGTIHLRRRHVLGGEGCPQVPMFANARGQGFQGCRRLQFLKLSTHIIG